MIGQSGLEKVFVCWKGVCVDDDSSAEKCDG
jgi:hypothetical protein